MSDRDVELILTQYLSRGLNDPTNGYIDVQDLRNTFLKFYDQVKQFSLNASASAVRDNTLRPVFWHATTDAGWAAVKKMASDGALPLGVIVFVDFVDQGKPPHIEGWTGSSWLTLPTGSPTPSTPSPVSIDSLTDVDTTTTAPVQGANLTWDSQKRQWVPTVVGVGRTQFRGSVADFAALTTITTPADGDLAVTRDDGHLHVYSTANGWDNIGPAAAAVTTLAGLSDVNPATVNAPNHEDILYFSSTTGKWEAAPQLFGDNMANVRFSPGTHGDGGVPIYNDSTQSWMVGRLSVTDLHEVATMTGAPNDGDVIVWDANANGGAGAWIVDAPSGAPGPRGPAGPPLTFSSGFSAPAPPPGAVAGDLFLVPKGGDGTIAGTTLAAVEGDLVQKTATGWAILGHLGGAKGDKGDKGDQGLPGVSLSVLPPVANEAARLGLTGLAAGSLVMQLDTAVLWYWGGAAGTQGGGWHTAGVLQGTQGPRGPQGVKGDRGSNAFNVTVITQAAYLALDAAGSVDLATIYIVTP